MSWDSSVVFSHLAFIAFVGNLLAVNLNTFAILFPAFEFRLVVNHLVTYCDLWSFVSLAGIASYLAISSHHLGTYLVVGLTPLIYLWSERAKPLGVGQ